MIVRTDRAYSKSPPENQDGKRPEDVLERVLATGRRVHRPRIRWCMTSRSLAKEFHEHLIILNAVDHDLTGQAAAFLEPYTPVEGLRDAVRGSNLDG